MTDETSLDKLTRTALDAFATRGLALVEVTCEARDRQRVRLDLAGQRLHLVLDQATPNTFVLELRDALHLDGQCQPGIVATTAVLANELHARLQHVRFVFSDAATAHPIRLAALAPDDVLVSVHFSTSLFEASATHWHAAFELGLDALLYAAARLQHELELAGYQLAGPLNPL